MSDTTIEFVDELPKIHRSADSGVWTERLQPLRERPGQWARVFGPTKNPHAVVNNLKSGGAAGVDPSEYKFSGRMLPAPEDTPEDKIDASGKTGYVFAQYIGNGVAEDEDDEF